MRIVVDSNMLESVELREFLSASPRNRAVLADYVWIEAYRYDAANSILRRLSVLQGFPKQVDVLRATRRIAVLDLQSPGIVRRMVRRDSRASFSRTVEALEQIRSGVPGVIEQVLNHARRAEQQSAAMSLGVPEILASLPELQEQMFTPAETRIIRTSNSFTSDMMGTIFGAADQIGEALFEADPHVPSLPPAENRWNTLYYRCALAIVIYIIAWIRIGSPKRKRRDRFHNDMVDLMLATLGTCFNGLMSKDAKALNLYWNLRGALRARGANIAADWTELGPFTPTI